MSNKHVNYRFHQSLGDLPEVRAYSPIWPNPGTCTLWQFDHARDGVWIEFSRNSYVYAAAMAIVG